MCRRRRGLGVRHAELKTCLVALVGMAEIARMDARKEVREIGGRMAASAQDT